MRRLFLASFCILLAACKSGKTSADDPLPQAAVKAVDASPPSSRYSLGDTFSVEGGPMLYNGLVLLRDSIRIDTILNGFGFHEVGDDSVVYLKLHIGSDSLWQGNHDSLIAVQDYGSDSGVFLYDGARKTKARISEHLPLYGYFASPSYSGGRLLYWGLALDTSGYFNIHAMRYDLKSGTLDSVFLFKEDMATDNSGYFEPVEFRNGKYVYQGTGENRVELDADFREP